MTWLSLTLLVLSAVNYGRLAWRIHTNNPAPPFRDSSLFRSGRVLAAVVVCVWLGYHLARFVVGAR